MNRKFYLLVISILFNITLFAQTKNEVTVKGTIVGLPKEIKQVQLLELSQEPNIIDTAKVDENGSFSFKTSKIKSTNIYKVQIDEKSGVAIVLSPGENVVFSVDTKNPRNKMMIKGSKESELVFGIQNNIMGYKSQIDSLEIIYKKFENTAMIDSVKKELLKTYGVIEQKKEDALMEFVKTHKTDLATILFIQELNLDENFSLLSEIDKALNSKYSDVFLVSELHLKIERTSRLAIGALAPDIILGDTVGNLISLSSFRGKYVLIDFWASWCSPCRGENPNVVKQYAKYKSKGFEVFSVSLDRSRAAWVNAIKSDKLTWTQVSDLKFWQSPTAKEYNVEGIPYTVLLDKEGKIIAKGLRGEELNKKLVEIFGE